MTPLLRALAAAVTELSIPYTRLFLFIPNRVRAVPATKVEDFQVVVGMVLR